MPPAPASVEELLAAMRAEYRAALPGKLAAIESLWQGLAAGTSSELGELRRLVHSLAGSAKTFGLPEVGLAARGLENEIIAAGEPGAGPLAARAAQIAAQLRALRQAAVGGQDARSG